MRPEELDSLLSGTELPWRLVGDEDDAQIENGDGDIIASFSINSFDAQLAVAAVNALPGLLKTFRLGQRFAQNVVSEKDVSEHMQAQTEVETTE